MQRRTICSRLYVVTTTLKKGVAIAGRSLTDGSRPVGPGVRKLRVQGPCDSDRRRADRLSMLDAMETPASQSSAPRTRLPRSRRSACSRPAASAASSPRKELWRYRDLAAPDRPARHHRPLSPDAARRRPGRSCSRSASWSSSRCSSAASPGSPRTGSPTPSSASRRWCPGPSSPTRCCSAPTAWSANSALVSKIYFPRIFMPAGVVVAGFVDLAISIVILLVDRLRLGLRALGRRS